MISPIVKHHDADQERESFRMTVAATELGARRWAPKLPLALSLALRSQVRAF